MTAAAERAREIFEALWGRRESHRVEELCTPDCVIHDPFRGVLDRTGLKELLVAREQSLPRGRVVVDEALEAGDRVVLRWSGTGSAGEEGAGVTGLSLMTLRDGRLHEIWSAWDTPRFGEAFTASHGGGAVFAFDRATPPA